MKNTFIILSLWGVFHAPFSLAAVDPTQVAAEYYFSRNDYKQALALWNQVLERHPESGPALQRVCELKVLVEGKPACRDLARSYLLTRTPRLTLETRRQFRNKVGDLMQTFSTNDAQSAFFQGLARVDRNECQLAISFFERALRSDRDNTKVLREKSGCEKKLLQWDSYLETLKAFYEANPWDAQVIESLGEAYIYFGQYEKAVKVYRTPTDRPLPIDSKLALALAYVELGQLEDATVYLEYLPNPPPIYWYLQSKLATGKRPQDIAFLQRRFVTAANEIPAEKWDPLRSRERAAQFKTSATQ